MRISTANRWQSSIDTLQQRQREMTEAQQRMTSGKRIQRASDDPSGAARAERALATEQRADAHQRALEASRNAMTLAESALGDADDLLQQVRETLVAAGNASYTDAERLALVERLSHLRSQLFAVANRGDGAGSYLFAGRAPTREPFTDAPGGVSYAGLPGQMMVAGDEPLPLTVDGGAAWLQARGGNGVFETLAGATDPMAPADEPARGFRDAASVSSTAWIDAGRVTDAGAAAAGGDSYVVGFTVVGGVTNYEIHVDGAAVAAQSGIFEPGKAIEIDGMSFTISGAPAATDRFELRRAGPDLNLFDSLDATIAELRTANRSAAEVTQTVQRSLRDTDASMGALRITRAAAGETLNRTDNAEGRIADQKLHAQTDRSNAEDVDMLQAISDFQNQQSGYDAALKTYASVQRMSLFQYLQV